MPVEKFSLSMKPEIVQAIEARREGDAPRALILGRELERYYALLARARARLRTQLSGPEIALICDACNGTRFERTTIPLISAEIADAIRFEGLAEKWGVDGAGLIARVRELDLAGQYALVDAVERYWAGPYHKEGADWPAVLA